MEPMTTSRWSVRPSFRRWAWVAGILLALLLAHAGWDYLETRWLRAAMTRYAPDYGVTPERAEIGADRDAAPYFVAGAALVAPHVSRIATVEKEAASQLAAGPALSGETLANIGAVLQQTTDAVALVDKAAAREFVGFAGNRPVNLLDFVLTKRLMSLRAKHAAARGDAGAAARALLAELKLEGTERSPITALSMDTWLLSWQATTARDTEFVLNHTRLEDDSLESLAAAMATADDDTQLARFFHATRDRWIQFYLGRVGAARYDGSFGGAGLLGDGFGSRLSLWRRLVRPLVARDLRHKLAQYASVLEAATTPWPDRLTNIVAASARQRSIRTALGRLGSVIYPGDPGWIDDEPRWYLPQLQRAAVDQAMLRGARVAIAVERFRRANGGQPPATLGQLVPDYLAAVPTDPFTGNPVTFVVTGDTYVVYSAGPNGRDDGGAGLDQPVIVSATMGGMPRESGDIGVRVRMSR